MSEEVILDITTVEETVTIDTTDPEVIEINVVAPEGPAGPAGPAGPNSITSATTSDGTGNISLNTLEVLGTLTASHIHGNLAGSVYAHVRAGENLAKGDPVYVSGSHGSGSTLIAIVSKADASNAAKMPAVGVMDAAVAANANGHMVITGTITEFNTAAYAVNAELYVANGGGLTATPPAASSQPVGRVERSNTNNGAFIVKVNGWASSGGNGASDANKLVRFGSAGTIPISSVTGSRSGIDSRTSFPNDDVTAATSSAVNNTIVKRDANGTITLSNLIALGGTVYQSTASFVYISGAAAAHRTALGLTSLATTTAGTGVATALAVNVGSAGSFITNGGALGTPSSGTLTNATGLPISTGVTGFGSGIATFLATPTSANLAAAVTDETGSGSLVLANSPTLTSPSIAGAASFTGTARPTSAATGSPAATDLITRADGDERYGEFLISNLTADGTPIQSQTTLQNTGCELTLGVGTWLVQAQTHVTNANTAAQLKFAGTLTGGTENYGNVMWGIGNSGVPGHDNLNWITQLRTLGNAARGWWKVEGLIRVTSGTATIRTQYAQNVSTAADTIVRAGTHLIARRLKS